MRVKKLLPLILIAVGALFLLSSCDALLDAIYASNTIDVNVRVYLSGSSPGYNSPYSSVTVTIGGASGATVSTSPTDYVLGGSPYADYILPSVKKLPNGTYTITTTYYDGASGVTWQTTSFVDPSGYTVGSIAMPYGGSNTATVSVTFF